MVELLLSVSYCKIAGVHTDAIWEHGNIVSCDNLHEVLCRTISICCYEAVTDFMMGTMSWMHVLMLVTVSHS